MMKQRVVRERTLRCNPSIDELPALARKDDVARDGPLSRAVGGNRSRRNAQSAGSISKGKTVLGPPKNEFPGIRVFGGLRLGVHPEGICSDLDVEFGPFYDPAVFVDDGAKPGIFVLQGRETRKPGHIIPHVQDMPLSVYENEDQPKAGKRFNSRKPRPLHHGCHFFHSSINSSRCSFTQEMTSFNRAGDILP